MSDSRLGELLQAILDDPLDLASRRVYADALSGAGDPRGEFIQVQCDLEACAASDPRRGALATRERTLLAKHRKTWTAPFAKAVGRPLFERGMIEQARVSTKPFIEAPGELLGREPVVSLSMTGLTVGQAGTLGKRPELRRLRRLRVAESSLGTRGTAALVAGALASLRDLDLYRAGVDNDGLEALRETVFPQLERLVMSGNRLTAQGVDSLLDDPRLARLTSLSLGSLLIGNDGARRIAELLELPALTELDLSLQYHTAATLAVMASNQTFARLRRLRLAYNECTGAPAIHALARLAQLEDLDLGNNRIGDDGAAALAASGLPLRKVKLAQCHLGHTGVAALARGVFPQLAELDLQYCQLSHEAIATLARTAWPLTHLNLWANHIGDAGAKHLADAGWSRTMRVLTLGYCGLGDAGIAALAAGSWPVLERIEFRGDSIGEAGARALATSTTMPALRSLKFEGTGTPKSPLTSLLKRGVDLEFSR